MRSEVDVVVIGAGIVGAATALTLTRAGSRVAVLDRTLPNTAGSGTTAGNLHIQTIHTRRPGQGTAVDVEQLLPLQKSTSTLWNTLDETVPGLGLNRCGGFMVAETEEQVHALLTKHRWERDAGIPTEVMTGDEARQALPLLGPSIQAATWCPWDGFAEPDLAGPALLRQAAAEGASVHPSTPVTGLTHDGDGWTVGTDGGTWIAPAVIDVAGPWMAPIAAMAGVSPDLVADALARCRTSDTRRAGSARRGGNVDQAESIGTPRPRRRLACRCVPRQRAGAEQIRQHHRKPGAGSTAAACAEPQCAPRYLDRACGHHARRNAGHRRTGRSPGTLRGRRHLLLHFRTAVGAHPYRAGAR
jgi:hypothetical protein